jgi:hypothetical protein
MGSNAVVSPKAETTGRKLPALSEVRGEGNFDFILFEGEGMMLKHSFSRVQLGCSILSHKG